MKRATLFVLILLVSLTFISSGQVEKSYLCEKCYYGLQNNWSTNNIATQIEKEKQIGISKEIIKHYLDNWETICSDETKRVLDEESLCNDLYFFVLKNKWDFNSYKISNDLKISYNILGNYLDNFEIFCNKSLPTKKLEEVNIYVKRECSLENKFFNSSMTFFTIAIDKKCNELESLNYIFRFEDNGYGMHITGIRIYFLFVVIISLLLIIILSISIKNRKYAKS